MTSLSGLPEPIGSFSSPVAHTSDQPTELILIAPDSFVPGPHDDEPMEGQLERQGESLTT
jgi:hypothetical protein